MKKIFFVFAGLLFSILLQAQNVGIGTTTPAAKLHIKGSADASQLIIDANATQTNTQPLIRLRDSAGAELMRIHSDNTLNTFIGLNSGRVNAASGFYGVNNTFIGSGTGYSNTSGYANTAIGTNALFWGTLGYNNTANGYSSLFSNTTGYNNTANGLGALSSNTTGNYNTSNGVQVLFSNTTGNNNIASGYQALSSNVAGSNATAIGFNAMLYANDQVGTFDNYNVAVGFEALRGSATAADNTGNFNTALATIHFGATPQETTIPPTDRWRFITTPQETTIPH